MQRDEFIKHLISTGCLVVREANQGYSVVRNVVSGAISGVPKANASGEIRTATMIRICATLGVCRPEHLIDEALGFDAAQEPTGPVEFNPEKTILAPKAEALNKFLRIPESGKG